MKPLPDREQWGCKVVVKLGSPAVMFQGCEAGSVNGSLFIYRYTTYSGDPVMIFAPGYWCTAGKVFVDEM